MIFDKNSAKINYTYCALQSMKMPIEKRSIIATKIPTTTTTSVTTVSSSSEDNIGTSVDDHPNEFFAPGKFVLIIRNSQKVIYCEFSIKYASITLEKEFTDNWFIKFTDLKQDDLS